MDTHSPLPWSIDDDGYILDAEGFCVFEGSERNQHLIITAVNAHNDLLAAAKAVVILPLWDEESALNERSTIAYANLNAAIMKASGEAS
jgi:hypothetical protein